MARLRTAASIAAAAACIAVAAGCAYDLDEGSDSAALSDYLEPSPTACDADDGAAARRARGSKPTIAAQVAATTAAVERVRGLKRKRAVRARFVSEAALAARIERLIRREVSDRELALGARALRLLGAIPPGFDMRRAIEALTESTAGLYDPYRDELLVLRLSSGRSLDSLDLQVLAHEIEHALVDQRFGLPRGRRADFWGDTHVGPDALAEGSAMLTQLRFLAGVDPDAARLVLKARVGDTLALTGLPHYLNDAFNFPYFEGVGFVCALYARGGWKAVDAAYRRPPTSSAEILFPERYLTRDEARTPRPLGRLPRPWRREPHSSGQFGAADLRSLFRAPGNQPRRALDRPLERAAAWGGGRIELWTRGRASALAIALVAHRSRRGLCTSVAEWYARAFRDAVRKRVARRVRFDGRRQDAIVACAGKDVRIAIAPTTALAARLLR